MKNINQFTRIGTFCEICRNVVCICKIGENSALNKAVLFFEEDKDDILTYDNTDGTEKPIDE
jgi:hypothetical protein